jgi:chaperonin cofactor prefoldin
VKDKQLHGRDNGCAEKRIRALEKRMQELDSRLEDLKGRLRSVGRESEEDVVVFTGRGSFGE